jgi:hypothetical protein
MRPYYSRTTRGQTTFMLRECVDKNKSCRGCGAGGYGCKCGSVSCRLLVDGGECPGCVEKALRLRRQLAAKAVETRQRARSAR